MSAIGDGKRRILIAEDDRVSRRVLEVFLTKWGYEVLLAENGDQALKILEDDNAPRVAVLDWMMPGMEGVQVCRRVREHAERPYIYILLLTARGQKEDMLAGLGSGADDYLTKPFDAQELRARLHVGERIVDLQDLLIDARDQLRFRATHDALTGVANRGVVLDALRRESARQVREGGPFGIVLADLDHFKNVNDAHGHLCGDAVLQEAAQRMSASVRAYDTVGRYGGEEFLIVVPASDSLGTLGLAERIRLAIAATPIATKAGDVQVTASLGVAVSTSAQPFDAQMLLQLADEALYRAKDRGRNRSELGTPAEMPDAPPLQDAPAKSGSR
ncbi:MAG: GGDEF domain-containing response regulator [Candidatus Acidiferrales bacterium]